MSPTGTLRALVARDGCLTLPGVYDPAVHAFERRYGLADAPGARS